MTNYAPYAYARPARAPHPHPGLRALAVVQTVLAAVGILGWLADSLVVAFCTTGIDRAHAQGCHAVRVQWWLPTSLTAAAALTALVLALRARHADRRLERAVLVTAAVLTSAPMFPVLLWFLDRANAAVPPA